MTVAPEPPMPLPPHGPGLRDVARRSSSRRMLRVAAERGIFGLLLDGPRTSADLACRDGRTRALAAPAAARDRRTGSVEPAARGLGAPPHWGPQRRSCAVSRAGWPTRCRELGGRSTAARPAMTLAHGCTLFEYLAQHPDEAAEFDSVMALVNAGEPQAVADAYDFAGRGAPGRRRRRERHAPRRGAAPPPRAARRAVRRAGDRRASDPELDAFADRVELVGGDFFEAVPAGADAYLLSHVVHDWTGRRRPRDPRARPGGDRAPAGRVLIVEMVMPTDDTPHPALMLDITMLLVTRRPRSAPRTSTPTCSRAPGSAWSA